MLTMSVEYWRAAVGGQRRQPKAQVDPEATLSVRKSRRSTPSLSGASLAARPLQRMIGRLHGEPARALSLRTPGTASAPAWSANEKHASAAPLPKRRSGTWGSDEYDKAKAPDNSKLSCLSPDFPPANLPEPQTGL